MRSPRLFKVPVRANIRQGLTSALLLLPLACHSPAPPIGAGAQTGDYGSQLGTVVLPLECSPAANRQLARGNALLHHMTYEGARSAFADAATLDANCALADWGWTMTVIHPLWSDPPGPEQFSQGQNRLADARRKAGNNQHLLAYISATERYFAVGRQTTERANLAAFAEGWRQASQAYPEDMEIASFYALALLGTADPADKSYKTQRQAGAIVESVLKRQPAHPGAHHYLVHAYDYPPLAGEALAVANQYGDIAPDIPHALHMPTHIFTRLGLWPESIAMNLRSAKAALAHPAGNQLSLHYLHAQDYLVYAYLQQAEDRQARLVQQQLQALPGPFQPHVASAYTFAAVPARLALERQQWQQAAALAPRQPADFPWDRYPAMEAISHFARGLGAARLGDGATVREADAAMMRLAAKTRMSSAYWAQQVDIMRQSMLAWREFTAGRRQQGLDWMQKAAAMEAATEKHPVTPGEILPARELLADMLLAMGRHQLALQAYKTALERNPNRYNSLYGAGHAAELAGDRPNALKYYGRLLKVAGKGDRPGLIRARQYVASGT